MSRRALTAGLLVVLGLLLAVAPALAFPDISGQWMGTWACDQQPCKGKKGTMAAKLKQDEGGIVTGSFAMPGLCKGSGDCEISHASIVGERFIGDLRCGTYRVGLSGLADDKSIHGSFDDPGLGAGSYKLNRVGK